MENLVIPRPVNERAVRRWISDQDGSNPATWSLEECLDFVRQFHDRGVEAFRQTDYPAFTAYRATSARARVTIDNVFAAVRNVTSPHVGLAELHDGQLECSFTWHDGAQYRVGVTAAGILTRLFRLELTGGWEWDEIEAREIPAESWRTVRAFSRDRAGKVLAPALADLPASASWSEAAAR